MLVKGGTVIFYNVVSASAYESQTKDGAWCRFFNFNPGMYKK